MLCFPSVIKLSCAIAWQSQNHCIFLVLQQKGPILPYKFKFFVYYSNTKGLSDINRSLRCGEETTQSCRTYSVPISSSWSWKRPLQSAHWTEDTVTEPPPLFVWWLRTLPEAQCPWSDFSMDPAQTLPPEISQLQMGSGCRVMSISHQTLLLRPHGSPCLYMSMYFGVTRHNASAELALLFLSMKSRIASLRRRGPEIHHRLPSPFWSTARKVY